MPESSQRDDYWYLLGICEGFNQASKVVGDAAASTFLYGETAETDLKAKALREISRTLSDRSDKARPEHRCPTYEHTRKECPGGCE